MHRGCLASARVGACDSVSPGPGGARSPQAFFPSFASEPSTTSPSASAFAPSFASASAGGCFAGSCSASFGFSSGFSSAFGASRGASGLAASGCAASFCSPGCASAGFAAASADAAWLEDPPQPNMLLNNPPPSLEFECATASATSEMAAGTASATAAAADGTAVAASRRVVANGGVGFGFIAFRRSENSLNSKTPLPFLSANAYTSCSCSSDTSSPKSGRQFLNSALSMDPLLSLSKHLNAACMDSSLWSPRIARQTVTAVSFGKPAASKFSNKTPALRSSKVDKSLRPALYASRMWETPELNV
mmetsp:Transcript_76893/g.150813  ORF Transcript_76893/g.150813 Transcript_76893/m.150813 type:complete len:305 (+) Transcript_76893:33-947(+)